MPSIATTTRQPAARRSQLKPKKTLYKAADYTLLPQDDGALIILSAAAVLTLPAKVVGLSFQFLQLADANSAFASAGSSDDIIGKGDVAGDSATFSTSSNKMGASAYAECIDTVGDNAAGSLKWRVYNLSECTPLTIA